MIHFAIGLNSDLQIRLHMLSGGYLPISSTSARMREQVKPFFIAKNKMAKGKKCLHPDRYANGRCKICVKVSGQRYIEKNLDIVAERKKQYRAQNPGIDADYYQKNKLEILEKQKKYVINNKEKVKAAHALYFQKNKINLRPSNRVHEHNRRAKKRACEGKITIGLFDKLFELQKGKCACCKADLKKVKPHMDHITPLAKKGLNIDSNIQLLCQPCNNKKHAKHPIDFMQSMGYLC